MVMNESWRAEVDQIESIADTKGVELDNVEAVEDETDDGEKIVHFRIYSADGPKTQVSKMPSVQTGEMTFRDDVQNKLSALKRHLNGEDDPDPPKPEQSDDSDTEQNTTSRTHTRERPSPSDDGPGAALDAEIEAIHERIDDIEARVEALEEKSDALDGLQQLMQGE